GALFVLPSRYEGFPNALLQAMSRGLACISFDCESGPADIAQEGLQVIIVHTKKFSKFSPSYQLALMMEAIMEDESFRKETAINSLQVTERFSTSRYFQAWDELIQTALSGKAN
ncbi:MAG: glycosyltransferase, partial [Planctomycetes bacterium]|nr:glycosyltransferase [Planctomycetota bacterium]